MRDGRIVEDHRLLNPLEEDLRSLAQSKLGQVILDPTDAPLPNISPDEEAVLRRVLARVAPPTSAPPASTTAPPQNETS
jgi:hypothetical protein